MKMKSEEIVRVAHMADSATTYVGSKTLPLTDITQSYAANWNDQCSDGCTEEKVNGRKTKAISRKKELLKWAVVAAKAEKGGKYISRKVMHLRNKSSLKTVPDYDQLSNESPKISLDGIWRVASSAYSAISDAILMTYSMRINDQTFASARNRSGRGNWITTDSEFVKIGDENICQVWSLKIEATLHQIPNAFFDSKLYRFLNDGKLTPNKMFENEFLILLLGSECICSV